MRKIYNDIIVIMLYMVGITKITILSGICKLFVIRIGVDGVPSSSPYNI